MKRYLYTQFHKSMIHINQKLAATHVCMDRGMDKQNVVYKYSGIVLSFKKKGNSDTFYSMDGPEDIILREISRLQRQIL